MREGGAAKSSECVPPSRLFFLGSVLVPKSKLFLNSSPKINGAYDKAAKEIPISRVL